MSRNPGKSEAHYLSPSQTPHAGTLRAASKAAKRASPIHSKHNLQNTEKIKMEKERRKLLNF